VEPSEHRFDAAVAADPSSRPGTRSRLKRAGLVGEQVMTDSLRDRVIAACTAKPGSAEDYPFGDEVAVFKVVGKMFALVTLGPDLGSVSLKCDPDLAAGLRRRHAAITAGYHLNKRHWNTVTLDGSVPEDELLDLIDHSYELVVARLPRAERDMLNT
jgi:predicted DNA-binding protein (MmcQ/YjbR family)